MKNIFWSFWEWPFYTGFTVYCFQPVRLYAILLFCHSINISRLLLNNLCNFCLIGSNLQLTLTIWQCMFARKRGLRISITRVMPLLILTVWCLQKVSMIRKYHNHTMQTNPWHCEEEPQNIYSNKNICKAIKAKLWVRCGAWLYRFLIFALFLTLNAFYWHQIWITIITVCNHLLLEHSV